MAPLYGGDPRLVYPINRERALYNELLRKYENAPGDLVIERSSLISEVVIPTNTAAQDTVFLFRSQEQNPTNAIRTTEIRLQNRDAFVIDRLSLMFADELNASTTPGTTVFQTWPNPSAVGAASLPVGGFGANAGGIMEAYNGTLGLTVNSVQFLKDLDCLNFLYADYAQASTLIFTASNTAFNSFLGDRGFYDLTPTLDLKGSDTIKFTLHQPDSFTFNSANHRVVMRLHLRGFGIQGGAEFTL